MSSPRLPVQQAVERALRCLGEGRFSEAEGLLRPHLAAYARNPSFLQLLGIACNRLGKYEEAMKLCGEAAALAPDDMEAAYNYATTCLDAGAFDTAIAHLERVLAKRPRYFDALNNLGIACIKSGRFDRAEAVLRDAVAASPAAASGHHNLGLALEGLGRWEAALDCFGEALDRGAGHVADIHHHMGCCLEAMQRWPTAIAYFEKSLQARPQAMETRWRLAACCARNGDLAAADRNYELALKLAPGHADLLREQAEVQKAMRAGPGGSSARLN